VGEKSLNASVGDELLKGATATKKAPIVPGSGHDKVSLNKQMWRANESTRAKEQQHGSNGSNSSNKTSIATEPATDGSDRNCAFGRIAFIPLPHLVPNFYRLSLFDRQIGQTARSLKNKSDGDAKIS